MSDSRRVGPDVAGVTVWQIKGEEVCLLFDPADHNQRFTKIRLAMSRWMAQRHKHLARASLFAANVVFDNPDRVKTLQVI